MVLDENKQGVYKYDAEDIERKELALASQGYEVRSFLNYLDLQNAVTEDTSLHSVAAIVTTTVHSEVQDFEHYEKTGETRTKKISIFRGNSGLSEYFGETPVIGFSPYDFTPQQVQEMGFTAYIDLRLPGTSFEKDVVNALKYIAPANPSRTGIVSRVEPKPTGIYFP
ncbi:MAG: hypothetical protein HGA90_01470 [Alphaproteobacteria bacterium]|nr:hypothetical protein [Alphaproteobacteria bacterium]